MNLETLNFNIFENISSIAFFFLKFLKPVLYFKCKKFKIYNYAYKYRKDKERIRRIHQ